MIQLSLTIPYLYDPAFVPVRDEKGTCTNMDQYELKDVTVVAEVLTVHFSTNKMRVRFIWNGSPITRDVSNQPFLDTFNINITPK
jgi:hypothetical protein